MPSFNTTNTLATTCKVTDFLLPKSKHLTNIVSRSTCNFVAYLEQMNPISANDNKGGS